MQNLTIYKDIMDSLSAQIAILDEAGEILETNRSWQEFGRANGLQPPGDSLGQNYLEVCERSGDETGELVALGIRRILMDDLQEFTMQYPCHSPTEERWFVVRVVKLRVAGKRKAVVSHENITPVMKAQQELKRNEKILSRQKKMLEDSNIALEVLLKHREQERILMEENVLANVRELVMPYLERLRYQPQDERNQNLLQIIASRLDEITSPFLKRLTSMYRLLTPREIDVAVLVREGKSSKEIADLLAISPSGVDFHRKKIRQKLGLTNEKSNLRSWLLSLQ
jgi:DNA-binding CsgD family transcriptional regulator/transcriptional regulator with PAS, ATPase and Fis domain